MGLGVRGLRDLDGGQEPVEDPKLAALLRKQSLKLQYWSLAAATLLTTAYLALP